MTDSPHSTPPLAVIVLGMHRSGTSALTSALAEMGFTLPSDVMGPAPDNPRGFFEPRAVAQLNERILKSLGGSWDMPGPFVAPALGMTASAGRLALHLQATYLEETRTVVKSVYAGGGPIVIKDPRITLFAPLWRKALEQLGYRPVFVHIHRDPREVAGSLRVRNGIPSPRGLKLWQTYVMAVLELAAETDVATVSYSGLLERPEAVLADVAAKIGVAVDPAVLKKAASVLAPEDRHQVGSVLGGAPPPLVADTSGLLDRWNALAPDERGAAITRLHARFEDATLYSGPMVALNVDSLRIPEPEAKVWERPPLLLHYHLFKNAGSSVDAMLKQSFGERWADAEFRAPARLPSNVAEVQKHVAGLKDIDAFSSHTALLPPPQLDDRDVLPIIFLRHPIDRLRSAYEFESTQQAETFGARLARSTDFPGYIRVLLDAPANTQARNFQAHRLATNDPLSTGDLLERAMRGLKALPFVGLVEAYNASIDRLTALIKPHYETFEPVIIRKNVSRASSDTLEDKLAKIAEELGPELHAELMAANQADLALHAHVRGLYPEAPPAVETETEARA